MSQMNVSFRGVSETRRNIKKQRSPLRASVTRRASHIVNFLLNKSDYLNFFATQCRRSGVSEAKFTKYQYLIIKNFTNSKVLNDFLLSYQKVLCAKQRCYPSEENIIDLFAEVDLQSVLKITSNRIVESQKKKLVSSDLLDNDSINLIGKLCFIGSAGCEVGGG